MARPKKDGLDYFNLDTDRYQDMKIKRLKKNFKCTGMAVYDYVLCEIYRVRGCFLEWDENTTFDVAEYFGLKESTVSEIVNYCCAVGLFDRGLFTSERILTSGAIQKRYFAICKSAKREPNMPRRYLIPEETGVNSEETGVNSEETGVNSGDNPTKETKGKETKAKETCGSDPQSPNPYPSLHPVVVNSLEPEVCKYFERLVASRAKHGILIDEIQQENYFDALIRITDVPAEQITILRHNIDGGTWKRLCVSDDMQKAITERRLAEAERSKPKKRKPKAVVLQALISGKREEPIGTYESDFEEETP